MRSNRLTGQAVVLKGKSSKQGIGIRQVFPVSGRKRMT